MQVILVPVIMKNKNATEKYNLDWFKIPLNTYPLCIFHSFSLLQATHIFLWIFLFHKARIIPFRKETKKKKCLD